MDEQAALKLIEYVIIFIICIWLPFKGIKWVLKSIFRGIKNLIDPPKPKKDYGYNTVYDNRSDRWEYNERKKRWEPVDKSRIREK